MQRAQRQDRQEQGLIRVRQTNDVEAGARDEPAQPRSIVAPELVAQDRVIAAEDFHGRDVDEDEAAGFEQAVHLRNGRGLFLFRKRVQDVERRNQIEGVPIKITTTTTLSGLENVTGLPGLGRGGGDTANPSTLKITQTTAITSIKETDVDEKLLAIPEGFTGAGGP